MPPRSPSTSRSRFIPLLGAGMLFLLLLLPNARAQDDYSVYASLGGFIAGPGVTPVVRVSIGHDSLLGDPAVLGVRISYDHGFGSNAQAPSAAAAATLKIAQGNVDTYVAIGGGMQFASPSLLFSEIALGGNWRVVPWLAPYVEGRMRYYVPNDSTSQATSGAVLIGVQFRTSHEKLSGIVTEPAEE